MLWIPFDVLYATSFGEGLFGWSSIWLTAGTIYMIIRMDNRQTMELGHTVVPGSLRSFSKFLIPKFDTPMFFTLPVAGSFCISCHVLMKSQSG